MSFPFPFERRHQRAWFATLIWCGCATAFAAEGASATAAPLAPPSAGLALVVDGRELPLGLLRAHLELEVTPGDLALVFPKWIPGTHAPAGRVDNLGGLQFASDDGRVVAWDRDEADPFRFVVHVPAGAKRLSAELLYIANQSDDNSVGADVVGSKGLAVVSWNCCVLYPEGRAIAAIPVDLSFTAPAGWHIGTALTVSESGAHDWRFARCSLRDLVDQPLIAGPGVQNIPLNISQGPPVTLDLGRSDGKPEPPDPELLAGLAKTVEQARLLFGRAHFRSYHFLLVGGDKVEGIGLEHSNCNLSGVALDTLTAYGDAPYWDRNVPVHEFIHSWCGKHVRPLVMATPDFQAVQRTGLLWVYEGLTQYLGEVVGVRAGTASEEDFRAELANNVNDLALEGGRRWRSVEDTARAGWQLRNYAEHYGSLRRGQDYYMEGMLFWLEADLIIRNESEGNRSLDDFCRAFFGAPVEPGASRTYTLDDVVAALDAVQHHDWRALIRNRIQEVRPVLDPAFLELGGYRLAFRAETGAKEQAQESRSTLLDARNSLGCVLHGGWVKDVVPGSPAEAAGLHEGSFVRAVEGMKLNGKRLEAALVVAHDTGTLKLTTWDGKEERVVVVKCDTGPRHAFLERVDAKPDVLSAILAPRQ